MPAVEEIDVKKEEEVDEEVAQEQPVFGAEEEDESASLNAIVTNLIDNNKFVFSYNNVKDVYENLSNNQLSNLISQLKIYDEFFNDKGDTLFLNSQLQEDIYSTETFQFHNENTVKQHKLFKNILFNAKEVLFQQSDGSYKIMLYDDLISFYDQPNKFVFAKISMGEKLLDSINTLKFEIPGDYSRGIAFSGHSTGFNNFILSSEEITFSNYLNLLPESRTGETLFQNRFDDIATTFPDFDRETEISFIYLKSNFIFQSKHSNMSIKGLKENLSTTETTTEISVADSTGTTNTVNTTGY